MSVDLLGAFLYLGCGISICLLSLLILRQSPGERLHRITAAMLFFGGLGPVLGGFGRILQVQGSNSPLLTGGLITSFAYLWSLFFPSLLLFALVFPQERPIIRRFPRSTWLLYVPHVFHLVLKLVLLRAGSNRVEFGLEAARSAESIWIRILSFVGDIAGLALSLLTRFHIQFFSLVNMVFIVAAILLLAQSLRGLRAPKLRRQLKVILFGLGSCMGFYALAIPVPTILSIEMPNQTRIIMISAALLLGTGSIAFAIVWRGFLDIGTVVRRAILFSATSGALVLTYFLTARQMDRALPGEVGSQVPLFQILFVILVVIFFHPLLGWMEETVDRLLAGERMGHRDVMRRLGREMTSILDLKTLVDTIVRTLKEALAVNRVHMVLKDVSGTRFQAEGPEAENLPGIPADHPLVGRIAEFRDPVLPGDLLAEIEGNESRKEALSILTSYDSQLLVPIQLPEGGGCIGFLSLGSKVTGGRFRAEEVNLVSILATQVGIAIRNARLHEEGVARKVVDEELALARTIQESILPRRSPVLEGIEVAAVNVSSRQVGGDYYDLIPMTGGRLGIAIGDVAGKGVPAALLMSMLHAALHAQMNGSVPIRLLMARMNRILYRSTTPEKFASFFLGVYDLESRVFRFTNGGHNFPLLLGREGKVRRLRSGGLLLGVLEEVSYEEESITLEAGDLAVFFTDGVTEEWRGEEEQFGEDRLVRVILDHRSESPESLIQTVRKEVLKFSGRSSFQDDFTLIILRVKV